VDGKRLFRDALKKYRMERVKDGSQRRIAKHTTNVLMSGRNGNKVLRPRDDGVQWKYKTSLRYAKIQCGIFTRESAAPPNLPAL